MAIQPLSELDVCVIGAGAGGPAAASRLIDKGLSVVLLEAGTKFDLDKDFSDLPMEMGLTKFAWPLERKANPFMLDDDYNPMFYGNKPIPNRYGLLNSAWGVGGTTLMYFGNHPRSHYYALDAFPQPDDASLNWRRELAPYYNFLEKTLPVPNAPMGYGPFDTHNAMTLVGANNYRGLASDDPDASSVPSKIPPYDPRQYDPERTAEEKGGFRGQPNNMTTNCWHCGNCFVGCHKPQEAQLKDKVKRATNASLVPQAEKRGLVVRDRSVVIAVLHPSLPDGAAAGSPDATLAAIVAKLPHLVVYGTYSPGPLGLPALDSQGRVIIDNIYIQPARIVVLAAGTIETPQLWMQSNWLLGNPLFLGTAQHLLSGFESALSPDIAMFLQQFGGLSAVYLHEKDGVPFTLPPNDDVGRNFMTHNENFVLAIYDKPVQMWIGQNSQARVDLPQLGMIESIGIAPSLLANAAFATDMRINPNTGQPLPDPAYKGPYDHPMPKFGVLAKENVHKQYDKTKLLAAFAEDDPVRTNRVFLDPQKTASFYVKDLGMPLDMPVVAVQYHPSKECKERSRKLTKIAMEMLARVPDTADVVLKGIFNLNMEANTIFHSMGTMGMGKAVSTDCEAIDGEGIAVSRLFVADASVLPNSLGGPNPVHTIQALALRTADKIVEKYFPERLAT